MTQIDEFESLFNSAAKPVFEMEKAVLQKIVVIVDEGSHDQTRFRNDIETFLSVIDSVEDGIEVSWIEGDEYDSVSMLLEKVKEAAPDLIVTYRNLHIPATDYPYSLGVYVDVLTQATSIPVILFPRPEQAESLELDLSHPKKVMAVTDHLAGDARLVSYAAKFTENNGTMILAHVEDEQTFARYIQTISRIPDIDTDLARQVIMDQLLKEPADYIESCKQGIKDAGIPVKVESVVTVGHHLSDYRNLIRDKSVNLLVLNTKDEDQLAMHALAYPLSVELRDVPMLLL